MFADGGETKASPRVVLDEDWRGQEVFRLLYSSGVDLDSTSSATYRCYRRYGLRDERSGPERDGGGEKVTRFRCGNLRWDLYLDAPVFLLVSGGGFHVVLSRVVLAKAFRHLNLGHVLFNLHHTV